MEHWISTWIETNWPLVFVALLFMLIGQFLKNVVWTKERAKKNRFYKTMRFALFLQPTALAAIAGLWLKVPSETFEGPVGHVIYWGTAGAVSSILFVVIRAIGKRWLHMDFPEIGRPSDSPPEPETKP